MTIRPSQTSLQIMSPALEYLLKLPVVRAFVWVSLLANSLLCRGANIEVTILRAEGKSGSQAVTIVVAVSSAFEIQSVTAELEGQITNLIFSGVAYPDPITGTRRPGWTNILTASSSLEGKMVTVTARDERGDSAQATKAVVVDSIPILMIEGPPDGTVGLSLHLAASCSNVMVGDRMLLQVEGFSEGGRLFQSGPTDTGIIDEVVDLSFAYGKVIDLRFTCARGGRSNIQSRRIFIDDPSLLPAVFSGSGIVLDATDNRFLIQCTEGPTKDLILRTNNIAERIFTNALDISSAFLTPQGAMFIASTPVGAGLYDWRDGQLIILTVEGTTGLSVGGGFAKWHQTIGQTEGFVLRDLRQGTNQTFPGCRYLDVAENGDVAIEDKQSQISIIRGGSTNLLGPGRHPLLDEHIVLYENNGISLVTSNATIQLDGPRAEEIIPGSDYRASGGWAVFTKTDTNGRLQIWRRSPDGGLERITYFAGLSRIESIGQGGAFTFRFNGLLYFAAVGAPPVQIGAAWSPQRRLDDPASKRASFEVGTKWYEIIGGTVRLIDQESFSAGSPIQSDCHPPPEDILLWWSGDGTAVDLTRGTQGVLINGNAFARGKDGLGLSFNPGNPFETNSANFLEVTNPPRIGGSQLSVAGWVKPSSRLFAGRIIDNITPGGVDGFLLDLFEGVRFIVGTNLVSFFPNSPLKPQTFSHIAATYDGSRLHLYINGRMVATEPGAGAVPTNSLSLRIGADGNGGNRFSGVLDELAVFGRALTESEIMDLYSTPRRICKGPQFSRLRVVGRDVQLEVKAIVGHTLSVFVSANLIDWRLVSTVRILNTSTLITLTPDGDMTFYRATSRP